MTFYMLGINHHSAAVEVRERVAFAPDQVIEALTELCGSLGLAEAVILSTCNRTELYVVDERRRELGVLRDEALDWLAGYHHLSAQELSGCAYSHEGEYAIRHAMCVAAGLDSMVLGEPQILGQMKSAYAVAQTAGTIGAEFGRLFPRVFSVAKRVRTDTAIGENPVSVAYAAVDLAGHIFTDIRSSKALLVGAGETIELVARHLVDAGISDLTIANRTLSRARDLAHQFGAKAVMLADIPKQLFEADIVITSTASQLPILGKGAVELALKKRKHRPMLIVDIAVPRDVESQVDELSDVYLYTVDDLQEIVGENLRSRQQEASKATAIIDEGLARYVQESRGLAAVDVLKAYRAGAEEIRAQELDKALRQLARGENPEVVVATLARAVTNKLIHGPTTGLKRASEAGRRDVLLSAQELLGLNLDEEASKAQHAQPPAPRKRAPIFSSSSVSSSGRTLQ
ncbi:MAG: glutamyl-tRNA reductase [Gammaproteobacteria bacterium]|nr:MAG: glutamyl-tRNA reductase [Gammaproteobacteria bacterium]